ncbi:hypothetical protein [Pseudonocardia sp. N23]|uniref:hypothetical protein n=1 Tax=Pseudonocardia sp. N23 TaxID=1987376 RepID=UPI000BFDEB64|nr:hypothetical protein [Pseudonocardia sp. N23]GAY08451.1 hypothetical protein TOK_2207 [Pseudonocardia sp. N23]
MWEDIAIAFACLGFTIVVAVVAAELWAIGRAYPTYGAAARRRTARAAHEHPTIGIAGHTRR